MICPSFSDSQWGDMGRRVPEECSREVASLYESCLQDDPKLRPSAADVVAALERDLCVERSESDPANELALTGTLNRDTTAVSSKLTAVDNRGCKICLHIAGLRVSVRNAELVPGVRVSWAALTSKGGAKRLSGP